MHSACKSAGELTERQRRKYVTRKHKMRRAAKQGEAKRRQVVGSSSSPGHHKKQAGELVRLASWCCMCNCMCNIQALQAYKLQLV